jgi:4-aminobutyrate aminotransferase/(S)-3-amino-2-methylpropionate transaminase
MVNPYEQYVAVCEKLNELTPGDTPQAHRAVQLRRRGGRERRQGRPALHRASDGIVAFDHAYHGRTNLTLAMTAKNMPYKHKFGPFASELYRVPMAYPYRWPGGPEGTAPSEAFDYITDQIHAQIGEENTAAVIIEPIQGEGGFITAAGRLSSSSSSDWCHEHDILFIADEVQSPASAAPGPGSPATTRAWCRT